LLLTGAVFMLGQYAEAVEVQVGGSIRPRFEYANNALNVGSNTPTAAGATNTFTTMQTRVNVKALVDDNASAFVQIQDVRTWGGENATTAPPSITQTGTSTSGQLDLHQAYLKLNNVLDSGISLKIGRQEMIFDEHRLIGNIGWIQQGQSFDAVRGSMALGALDLTAFYARTVAMDTHPTLGNTVQGNATFESSFSGVRLTYKLGGKGDRITPYFYYALNPSRTGAGVDNTPDIAKNIKYVGAYFLKHFGGIRFRFDGAYETGKKSQTVDIRAYMLTAALGTKLDIGSGANVTLWFDYLSGDDGTDATKVKTFTTPYATNHAYYGHMDNYLNNPSQGLMDAAIKFWVKPTPKLKFVVHGHLFRSAKSTTANTSKDLGQEIDTQLHYPLARNTKLVLGYSHYFAANVNAQGSGRNKRDGNWGFAMVAMKF